MNCHTPRKGPHISVIEKTNIGEKDGYFVHITTNMDESIKRAEKQGMKLDETLFFMVSRYQYMDIDMFNNNLAVFKKQLENKLEIYVVKGDIFKLQNEVFFDDIKVTRDKLEVKAFDLQCVPSIYTQKEYLFDISEYNPKDLIKDEVKK